MNNLLQKKLYLCQYDKLNCFIKLNLQQNETIS